MVEEIVVIHLVRHCNSISLLNRFVNSYLNYPSGLPHRLVFLLKGFNQNVPLLIEQVLGKVSHSIMFCPDVGFDIGSYRYAAKRTNAPLLFFTNSHTEFVSANWLKYIFLCYKTMGAGAVGATGSWQSKSSYYINLLSCRDVNIYNRIIIFSNYFAGLLRLIFFPRFPNPHLRTNAFLISRDDYLKVCPMFIFSKFQAFLFESGYSSLSRKLRKKGKYTYIVGKDGNFYNELNWDRSEIFWQDNQENILIHDNRTRDYEHGSIDTKRLRYWGAWLGSRSLLSCGQIEKK